ncbi:Hypothetical predicted protein, partial [Mytilus galloprovincialis]
MNKNEHYYIHDVSFQQRRLQLLCILLQQGKQQLQQLEHLLQRLEQLLQQLEKLLKQLKQLLQHLEQMLQQLEQLLKKQPCMDDPRIACDLS